MSHREYYTDKLHDQIEELEKENKELKERVPDIDPIKICFDQHTLLAWLAEMKVAKEREHELDEQEEKRVSIEPIYHSIIKLGSDAEIEVSGENITIVMTGHSGMKHCLEIDIISFLHIYLQAPHMLTMADVPKKIANRGSEWRYEIFDSNRVESLLSPKLEGSK